MSINYPSDSRPLEVIVERVLPFGVFVRLPDGVRGYIRKRELDIDADVEPSEIVQEGQKIQAVVIKTEGDDTHVELSRRATLKDPWPEFAQRNHVGDVVRSVVRALHPNGAFVRVQAGVNGFVPLPEIATWQLTRTEDVLWVGDTVSSIITNLSNDDQRLTLSIKALMLQREAAKTSSNVTSQSATVYQMPAPARLISPTSSIPREQLGTILVVDDHDDVRSSLTSWLKSRGFVAVGAESLEKAIGEVEKCDCEVLLLDLNLVDKDGLELAHHFRKNGHRGHICIMSSLDTLHERAAEIEAAEVEQVFPKPLDVEELEAFLLRLASGEQIPRWRATPRPSANLPETKLLQGDRNSIQQGVQNTLEQFTQLLRADVGMIFQLDRASEVVSVLARAGDTPIRTEAVYGLNASPVRDVIRGGEAILENHVSENAGPKFAKLLDLLTFESCIGVPVNVNDDIQHAAFFFHHAENAFSHYRLRDAQAGSALFAALLTREILEGQLQSLAPMLLSGELARGFGHDVFNKITALDLEARLLIGQSSLAHTQATAQHLLDLIVDLKATVQAFQELLQTKEIQEVFEVNHVVSKAVDLLRPIAQKERAKIDVNLADGLPLVNGNSIMLQQVFLNLMLNSVQQMSLKAEKYKWKGQRLLRISTSINNKTRRIRIRFTDNGPGIHRAHMKRIFSPGFSTRGGSGLGLYIASGFIQSLCGVLFVRETLVPLGTTFVVEVPFAVQEVTP